MKQLKRWISVALTMAMVWSLTACGAKETVEAAQSEDGDAEYVVRLGVFEPQTMDNSSGGNQEILGIRYANEVCPSVEIDGVRYDVELVYADNASSVEKAPIAAQDLIEEGVSVVLGSYGSDVCIAAGEVFAAAGMPAIGITCTSPKVTELCEMYYRICFVDSFQGSVLAGYAKNSLNATKAYCLTEQDDEYSEGLCSYFMEAFGVENCIYQQFPKGAQDLGAYVTTAQAEGCDVFFAPVYPDAASQIIARASAQALGMPILGGDTWDSGVILNAAKGTDADIFVSTFYQEGADAQFDADLKKWITSTPENLTANGDTGELAAFSVMGYDAYFVALEAIKAAGSTEPAKVQKALPNVQYQGVAGVVRFDENRNAIRDSAYIKTCDTTFGTWNFCTVAKAN